MKDDKNGFLHFTNKERTGILVLALLIICSIVLPGLFRRPAVLPDQNQIIELRAQLEALKQTDSAAHYTIATSRNTPVSAKKSTGVLFRFNPNTLKEEGWRRLGVPERTITTVMNYLQKGGRFRRAEDLGRIYGMPQGLLQQLLPYVSIDRPGVVNEKNTVTPPGYYKKPEPRIVDINTADSSAFQSLPGIGPVLSGRIIRFRDKLGGFHSVEQVAETYGLQDSVFSRIRPYLVTGEQMLQPININEADLETFRRHPYISYQLAKLLVAYRQQHGPYKSVEDINKLMPVTKEVYEKIARYLTVGESGKLKH